MSNVASYWFSPTPSEVASSRLSLDFGLRAADLFFRELVVPGLGRIWFVRQLSWPLAALALHKELANDGSDAPKPTAICHGIEALACKLSYINNPNASLPRCLGRRAFGRDAPPTKWSFAQLRQATNYVRNTHRQAATRAVRVDNDGLGFVRGSSFNTLELEPVGRALAEAFLDQHVGRGQMRLRKWLTNWIQGNREIPNSQTTLLHALAPDYATKEECDIVRSRLLGTVSPACEKRKRLASAVGRAADLPDIENSVVVRLREHRHGEQQANEIVAARAFGAMLDRTRDAVASLSIAVEPARKGVNVAALAANSSVMNPCMDLRTAANSYIDKANATNEREPTSRSFANAVIAADECETIRFLVRRAGELLALADGSVVRGPLFRTIVVSNANDVNDDDEDDLEDGASKIEPDRKDRLRTGRTFRIANLHSLLRDIYRRGAR